MSVPARLDPTVDIGPYSGGENPGFLDKPKQLYRCHTKYAKAMQIESPRIGRRTIKITRGTFC